MKSMTGFGVARRDVGDFRLVVEVKSVNGRFLKTSCKLPSTFNAQEAMLEGLIKARLRRGSVTLGVFMTRVGAASLVQVNEAVVRAYQEIFARLHLSAENIPMLPGVMGQAEREEASEELIGALRACAEEALHNLEAMRAREGQALTDVLLGLAGRLEQARQSVHGRAPGVVREYQQKLGQRLQTLLEAAPASVSLDAVTLAREVAVFADRCDITEEVDRLGAHLQHLRQVMGQAGEVGRTLDFLGQEMLREVNTIGSKSADSELSRVVVELKADVERLKEQVANIE